MKKYSIKKIVALVSIFLSVLIAGNFAFAGCVNGVDQCSGTSEIPEGATCSNYFLIESSSQATTTTYCDSCGACVAGASDCAKGTCGCNECHISNGHTNYTGILCSGGTSPSCSDGGGSYSCTT